MNILLLLLAVTPIVPIVPPPDTNFTTYYFSATATSKEGLESDFSNEVTFTNYYSNLFGSVNLYWDRSPSTNVITNYSVYMGPSTRFYTNNYPAKTNLTLNVRLYPAALTNRVLNVTVSGGATNIAWSRTLTGPWTMLGTTNYRATNITTPRYFRGVGKRGNKVNIRTYTQ